MELLTRLINSLPNRDTRELHERFPQILHWKVGDYFRQHTISSPYISNCHLISINSNGFAYVEECDNNKISTGLKHKISLKMLYKNFYNLSAKERSIDAEIAESADYMELITEFQLSLKELTTKDV